MLVVDVSDTTQAPTGTTKKMTTANLFTSPSMTTVTIASGGLIVSAGTTAVQALTAAGSVQITGGAVYNNDLGFAGTASGLNVGFYSLSTGSPTMLFDHRATSNSGGWSWNNGSAAATPRMTLSGAGALGLTGDLAIATSKFTVAAASGNTAIAGTLGVTGDVAINTSKFTVAAASGNTAVAGTLAVTGDVTIGASTLIVTASSGSILSAGSVQAGGRGTFQNSLIFAVGGAGGGVPFSWLSTIATATVSSSAVALSSLTFGKGGLVMVYGTDGTNKFLDLVLYGATTTTVISSTTVAASPVARTYSMAASTLKLAMASGSYSVDTTEIAKGN